MIFGEPNVSRQQVLDILAQLTGMEEPQEWQGLSRYVMTEGAFDRRSDDPKQNYGIGSATIRMVLKGPRGAIQFYWMTGMYGPDLDAVLAKTARDGFDPLQPMGCDLGCHSPIPRYEETDPTFHDCPILEGACYFDGSGLQAMELLAEVFAANSIDIAWERMRDRYESWLSTEEEVAMYKSTHANVEEPVASTE